jgi:hypothetical protein
MIDAMIVAAMLFSVRTYKYGGHRSFYFEHFGMLVVFFLPCVLDIVV